MANVLAETGVTDVPTLCAALLHDTVEDTDTTFEELEKAFGPEITQIVREVTDDKEKNKEVRKREQVAHAASASVQAKQVKLADKLHNFRGLLVSPPTWWDAARVQGYFMWGKKVVDACAGTNPALEAMIEREIWNGSFELSGQRYPCLPPGDHESLLEAYYADMRAKDQDDGLPTA